MDNKERKIGEVLKGQQVDLDKNALWSNLEGSLPKKESKRRGFWWLFLLLIPISMGAYFFSQGLTSENESNNIEEGNSEQKELLAMDEGNGTDIQVLNEAVNNNVQEESNQENLALDLRQKQEETIVEDRDKKNYELKVVVTKIIQPTPIIPAYETENQKIISGVENNEELISDKTKNVLPSTYTLETNIDPLIFQRTLSPLELRNNLTPTLCCINQKWSLALLSGVNKSISKVIGLDDREIGVYGTSLGLIVDYKLKNRWTLSGGVAFDQLTSRYSDQREIRSSTTKTGVSEIVIDALGMAGSVQGPIKEITVSKRDISWHRRQKSFDLQLSLKRDFILSYYWKLGLSGGIAYNLYTETSGFGYQNGEHLDFYKFNIDKENNYRKSGGLKPLAGIELSYRYKQLEILLQANYKWSLEPINTHTEHYQLKHSQTGIQLGTRYYLNGN